MSGIEITNRIVYVGADGAFATRLRSLLGPSAGPAAGAGPERVWATPSVRAALRAAGPEDVLVIDVDALDGGARLDGGAGLDGRTGSNGGAASEAEDGVQRAVAAAESVAVVALIVDDFAARADAALAEGVHAVLAGHRASDEVVLLTIRHAVEVQAMRVQLRRAQRLEAVGMLAGGVANDMNNLLTAINGYGEILSSGLGDSIRYARLRRYADQIRSAGERGAELTHQLLAFTRRQRPSPGAMDLNRAISGVRRVVGRLVGSDIRFSLSTEAHLGLVVADPGYIEQALLNLVVNAVDAMDGGGTLVVETANARLLPGAFDYGVVTEARDYVMLAVADSGAGMTAETRARALEPFFTTKTSGEGSGLGLSTVRGIVQECNGVLAIDSAPGEGTTVRVYLPRATKERTDDSHPTVPTDRSQGSETVLVVDDELAVRALVRDVLEEYGYRVLECEDGYDALQRLGRERGGVDLVLSDVNLPGMTGPRLQEALLARGERTRFLYMSGYPEGATASGGVLAAGTPFVEKPFRPAELAEHVRAVLDNTTA